MKSFDYLNYPHIWFIMILIRCYLIFTIDLKQEYQGLLRKCFQGAKISSRVQWLDLLKSESDNEEMSWLKLKSESDNEEIYWLKLKSESDNEEISWLNLKSESDNDKKVSRVQSHCPASSGWTCWPCWWGFLVIFTMTLTKMMKKMLTISCAALLMKW